MYNIYQVFCQITKKVYIGYSVSPKARRKQHFKSLSRGKHTNSLLQKDFTLYGRERFTFSIIERDIAECDIFDAESSKLIEFLESEGLRVYSKQPICGTTLGGEFVSLKIDSISLEHGLELENRYNASLRKPKSRA